MLITASFKDNSGGNVKIEPKEKMETKRHV